MRSALGNLFVLLAAMGLSEATVWHFASGRGWGYVTALGGVLAAYSLDAIADAPADRRARTSVRFGPPLLAGAAAVIIGLWHVPANITLVALLGVMAGAYVPLKRFIPKGLLTAGAWAMALTWLPPATTPTLGHGLPVAGCLFLIVAANAILCDTLDVDIDRQRGVRGIAPWLGARRASRFAALLATIGAALAMFIGLWPLLAAAVPLIIFGLLAKPAPAQGKELQRSMLDLALCLPGIVVLCLDGKWPM